MVKKHTVKTTYICIYENISTVMFSNVTGPPVGISYVEMAVKARKASYKALIDRETILCERYPYRVAEKGYGKE